MPVAHKPLQERRTHSDDAQASRAQPVDEAQQTTHSLEVDQTCNKTGAWYVYIVECNDGTLYTGITTDLTRRLDEHNGLGSKCQSARGANYTRARRPVALVYREQHGNRSEASRREWQLKQLPRTAKQRLVKSLKPV